MEKPAIQDLLRLALGKLIVDDLRLLMTRTTVSSSPVWEPAVASALASHLRTMFARQWDVDCDYNRATNEAGEVDVKRLAALGAPVRPDIIVHRRGLRGPGNNVLALELKTNAATQLHVGGSQASIDSLRGRYDYQHATLLDLRFAPGELEPHWTWHERRKRHVRSVRVYLTQVLQDLADQGRAEELRRYGPD